MATLLTDDERQAIAADIRGGELSRNDIARKHGRAQGTVTAIAEDLGLTFDRAATKSATAAHQADIDKRMAQLADDLLSDAERLRAQLWEPCRVVVDRRGRKADDGVVVDLDEPSFADKRHIVASARMCVMTVNDIRSKARGGDEGRSMIERLVAGLAQAAMDSTEEAA